MNQHGLRQEPPDFGGEDLRGTPQLAMPALTPVTKRLLQLNFGIWLVTWVLSLTAGAFAEDVVELLALTPATWRAWFPFVPVWQVVTYGFLHSVHDPMHILFNSLFLYFFGTMLEGIIGSRRFLVTYLAALVIGGVGELAWRLASGGAGTTLGASGGVLGLLVACAVLRPNTPVIFIIVRTPLWLLALILVGIDFFWLLSGGGGTAYLVHVLGAAYGFLAARRGWIFRDPLEVVERHRSEREARSRHADDENLDRLLERIHKEGIHSLSRKERDFLKRVSRRK